MGVGKAEMMQNTRHTRLSHRLMGTAQAFLQGSLFEAPVHIVPRDFRLLHQSPVRLPLPLFNAHSLVQVCMFGLSS